MIFAIRDARQMALFQSGLSWRPGRPPLIGRAGAPGRHGQGSFDMPSADPRRSVPE